MMKNTLKYAGLFLAAALLYACEPAEDRIDISGNVDKSKLQYTHKQLDAVSLADASGGNLLAMSLTSTDANVLWRAYGTSNGALIAMGNNVKDTLDLPFQGEYKITVYAAFRDGAVTDSFNINTVGANPKTFENPYWLLLSNGADGKYWKISAKYVGPESDYNSNWWQPDISGETWGHDSIYFDLNLGFNFKHFNAGKVTSTIYSIKSDSYTAHPYIITLADKSVTFANDDAAEMAPANANTFRIYKLTTDTLIVGQGASLTASRQSEDWAWYWIYVRSNM